MAERRRPSDAGRERRRLGPQALAPAVAHTAAEAARAGALVPLSASLHEVVDDGVRYAVRRLEPGGLARKPSAGARRGGGNPFLPYEEALYVGDLTDDHVLLLNKFPVVDGHVLLVTRAFAEQQALPAPGDLEALWRALAGLGGLAFYNAGPVAGASQPHRHWQLVPSPLGAGPEPFPLAPRLEAAPSGEGPLRVPGFRWPHAAARVAELAELAPAEAGAATLSLLRELRARAGCPEPDAACNLLLTRRWLWVVPRRRAAWRGVPVNGLGYAGSLLARDSAQLRALREAGPSRALRSAAGAPAAGPARPGVPADSSGTSRGS